MNLNVRKITRREINEICDTVSRNLLSEGYSAQRFEAIIDAKTYRILTWLNRCRSRQVVSMNGDIPKFFHNEELTVSLRPFMKDGIEMPQEYLDGFKVRLYLMYLPLDEIAGRVAGRYLKPFGLGKKELHIKIAIGRTATKEDVISIVKHEITHAIDEKIEEWNNFSYRKHEFQMDENDKSIPFGIKMLLYMLWDTREFNAWQANVENGGYSFNEFVDDMMGYLEFAESITSPYTWMEIKKYIMRKEGIDDFGFSSPFEKKRGFMRKNTPESFKKYFIDTCFNKLKKFIKKVDIN